MSTPSPIVSAAAGGQPPQIGLRTSYTPDALRAIPVRNRLDLLGGKAERPASLAGGSIRAQTGARDLVPGDDAEDVEAAEARRLPESWFSSTSC